ncbi:MAG: FkbM family methyltransferase [Candidatus Nitrosopumilus sp. bin_32a]
MDSGYASKISYMYGYFFKQFGFWKTLKGIFFYNYRILKRISLDTSKENTLTINGYKFITIPNDKGISEELLMFKTHEPLSTKLFEEFLKPGMVCMDVGSNIGYYVCLESKIIGKEGKIIAIEPSPLNFKYLQKNVELQEKSNIELYNFACGDKDGEINFSVSNRSNWSRVVSDDLVDAPPDAIIETVTIPIKKIDSFIDEKLIDKLDFVRMDVEGYEKNILQGMKQSLQKFKPLIQLEMHLFIMGEDATGSLFDFFSDLGYRVSYYVPREMDVPILGNMNDVKIYSFDDLRKLLKSKKLPMNFMLFLKNKNHN